MKKNQGFSLVELIVVIAIMAVLVGVLAPAYLRYVEKSRKSSDVSSISDIIAAAEKVAIDPQFDLANVYFHISSNGSGQVSLSITTTANDTNGDITGAITEWYAIVTGKDGVSSGTAYTMKAKEFKVEFGFTGHLLGTGAVQWTGSSNYTKLTTFSPDFKKKWSLS